MSKYVVVSDHSGKGDMQCIDNVAKVLEDAGHEVEKGGVDANSESRLRQEGKDTIGVFLVNGACLATFISISEMVKGGNCSEVFFGMPKPIMSDPFNKHENWTDESRKLKILDESWIPSDWHSKYSDKWTLQEASDNIEHITCVYGDSCEDVANNILNGATGGGDSGNSTSSSGEGSIMSGWESITDLLKPLDGEAMVVVRGDAVIVKRIYPPEATQLWAYEGINIVADSVKISDYSPEIYNTFTIKWGASFENEMEASFEKHKELFGERRTEINAVYEVPVNSTDDTGSADGSDTETGTGSESTTGSSGTDTGSEQNEDSGLFGFVTNFFGGGDDETQKQLEEAKQQAEQGGTGSTGQEQETKEIPITDEAEAYLFALKQVGKARRKDGHKVECKVIGNKRFEVGEWCRVYIPSFNEDCIMFISKVSHDSGADNEWITSLTMVDYPPSLGSGQSNSPSSSNESEDTSTTDGNSLTENEEDSSSGEDSSSDDSSSSDSGDDSSSSGDN